MSYSLGLDLGTTNSAVAIADEQGTRMLSLGTDGPVVASVIHVTREGDTTFGQPALRRAESDPAGVAREFKRRFGDTTPLLLHGTPVAANDLTVALAGHLVGQATRLLGASPTELAVCHPANWGPFKTALLTDTLNNSSLPRHRLITEPEAAAIHYATQERVAEGTTVAVYDLGGGTFDVAVLRKLEYGWELLGRPGGIERLGGIDFDTALFQHVIGSLGIELEALDGDDPTTQAAIGRLRSDCTEAKHALSADTSTTISVLLPEHSQQVRVTRSEFERLIRPAIARTLETFDTTISSADLGYGDIDRILMVGGSSRIPVVAAQVASHTGRTLATDAHPKHACALGAAALLLSTDDQPSGGPIGSDPADTDPAPGPNEPEPGPGEPESATDEPVSQSPWTDQQDPDLSANTKLGGMFQDLPHISEGLPEFMDRGRRSAPMPSSPPVSAPPAQTPTQPPAALPATRANPVLVPTEIHHPAVGATRPAPAPAARRKSRSASAFFIGLFLMLGLGGGAAYFLGLFGQTDDAESSSPVTVEPGSDSTVTTDAPIVNETNCPDDRIPDPGTAYMIKEIAADDRDGGANARSGPGLGPSTPPVTVLVSFTPVELAPASCEVDADGRVWWGVTVDGSLLWVAASLIIPAG